MNHKQGVDPKSSNSKLHIVIPGVISFRAKGNAQLNWVEKMTYIVTYI